MTNKSFQSCTRLLIYDFNSKPVSSYIMSLQKSLMTNINYSKLSNVKVFRYPSTAVDGKTTAEAARKNTVLVS